jgi:hypothetical protein
MLGSQLDSRQADGQAAARQAVVQQLSSTLLTLFKILSIVPLTFVPRQISTEEVVRRHVCDDNSSTTCWPKCCGRADVFDVNSGVCQSTNRSFEVFFEIKAFDLGPML